MGKFKFSWIYYIIVRKRDNAVWTDFGKYQAFAPSYELYGGKRVKYYTSITKIPSWASPSDEYEIKKMLVECKEVE